jgi:hypothetical protein
VKNFRVIYSVGGQLLAESFSDISLAEIFSDVVGGYVQVLNPIHGWIDVIYE